MSLHRVVTQPQQSGHALAGRHKVVFGHAKPDSAGGIQRRRHQRLHPDGPVAITRREAAREIPVLPCGPLPQLGLGGVCGLFGQRRTEGIRGHTGSDVPHSGAADLAVCARAEGHGQKQGLPAPLKMAEDVLPLQDAGLREALHIGLKPDGPGGGGGEKGCSAPFQKSEGGAVGLAPRAEIPRGLPDVDGLRLR